MTVDFEAALVLFADHLGDFKVDMTLALRLVSASLSF